VGKCILNMHTTENLFHGELMQLLFDQSLEYGVVLSPDLPSGEVGDLAEALSTDNSRWDGFFPF